MSGGSRIRIGGVTAVAAACLVLAPSAEATFPGQNGRIAYIDGGNVATMNPDGTDRRILTRNAGDEAPFMSGSGTKIVYAHKGTAGNAGIFIVNADGTGRTRLTRGHFDFTPSFSPNGRKIAFARGLYHKGNNFSGIYAMSSDGSHLNLLTHDRPVFQAEESHPVYSPDDKTIVFQSLLAEDGGMSSMNSNGTNPHGLGDNLIEPSFAPDGQHILYTELFSPLSQVGVMDPNGKQAHDITNNTSDLFTFTGPNYSPDGTKIVSEGSTLNRKKGTATNDVYVMTPDGTGMTKITTDGVSEAPNWGPATAG